MSTRGEEYDIVIAGLGPAGSALLWHTARRGFRVVGIDMRKIENIWGKPCGDAIGAHHTLEAKLELPSNVIKNNVSAIDIYSPSEKIRYRIHGEGYIIDRNAYGRWLIEEAEKHGADILLKTNIIEPIVEGNRVVGVRIKSGEKVEEVRAKITVEATGFTRVIRRKLPSNWSISEDILPTEYEVAYREIIVYENHEVDDPSVIRIYLNQEIAPGGYWWFFPESKTSVNVGLGVQNGRGYPTPITLYRTKLTNHPLLRHRYIVRNSAGAPLPTRRPSNTMVGPGVIAIGDAGYTVNPIHGGGMGYSFRAAYFALKAIEDAFSIGDFTEKTLWRLNLEYMKNIGAKQASLDIFRIFLQNLPNNDLEFGMEKKLLPEQDIYYTSTKGELELSVVEKASIILRGLSRPSLLLKLKTVADYMKRIKELYENYPETPSKLPQWIKKVDELYYRYKEEIGVK